MKDVAARFGGKGMQQQWARGRVAWIDQSRGHLEVLSRLRFTPEHRSRRQLLQTEGIVALRVTDIASGVARAFLEEDRFDPFGEKPIVERGRRSRSRIRRLRLQPAGNRDNQQ